MFIFERLFIIKFPSRNDVVNASHQAFTIIAEAIRNDDLDVLRRRGLCTVYSRLRYQKNELDKLTSKQKKVFNITKEDLIGHQGILRVFYDHPFHNIRLTALPNDENDENSARTTYLLYGVMLIALYKKNLLFKTVSNHPLPSTYKWGTDERMVLKMPAGYDFLQRKHLVMYLEFAQPLNLETRTLVDDVTLYDFHIGCF
ncbi:unnamed protein product [Anisakis simplex]|uniref:MAGE domain-containing protein n=1 Tax=Anisakis simplex TaxID=6269 RepID=A0A0M3JTH9_ANISI|nr:unnamed protein product [Anisakis simplex]